MAIEKILNTRIALKVDTLENWNASSIELKKGELAIATAAITAANGAAEPVTMIKVGEGNKTFANLPWALHAKASDVLAACKTEDGLKAFINTVITSNNLASKKSVDDLAERVTTAESDIVALENAVELLNGNAETAGSVAYAITEAIKALDLANTYDVKGAAAQALVNAKEYTDALANGAVKNNTDAIAVLNGESEGSVKKAVADAKADLQGKIDAINNSETGILATAKGYTDAEIDTVEEAIANLDEAYKAADSTLDTKISDEVTRATGIEAGLRADVDTIKADYLKAEHKTALETLVSNEVTRATGAEEALATRIKAVEDDYLVEADKTELSNAIADEASRADAAEKIIDAKVEVIKADYLKTADKTELQNNIDTLTGVVEALRDGVDAEKVDGVLDLIKYVEEHGPEVKGMQENISANAKAIADEITRATGVEANLAELIGANANDIEALETSLAEHKTAADNTYATQAALAAEKAALQAEIDADVKAASDALTEVINTKANAEEVAASVSGLDERLATVEEMLDGEGSVATQIETAKEAAIAAAAVDATTKANKALEDAKAYADQAELDAVATANQYTDDEVAKLVAADDAIKGRLDVIEGESAGSIKKAAADTLKSAQDYADQAEADAVTAANSYADSLAVNYATAAQGAKADSALQSVEVGTGLKVSTKANNKQTIEIDTDVVFIFNCGDSTTVI